MSLKLLNLSTNSSLSLASNTLTHPLHESKADMAKEIEAYKRRVAFLEEKLAEAMRLKTSLEADFEHALLQFRQANTL